MLQKSG